MDWEIVIRELHLSGGCRAYNDMDPKTTISPKTKSNKTATITLKKFTDLYDDIESIGLKIIGCDFFTTSDEAQGFDPPQWRTKCMIRPIWLCTEQGQEWSFISNSAFNLKDGILYDISSRISHQIRACEWRIRQLSECYADQLRSSSTTKREHGDRFKNGYTSLCYLALHSFLVDACILRDYLAEFYWHAIASKKTDNNIKVTTLSGLIKQWRSISPTDPTGKEIQASSRKGSWLFELGAYRDLVVHTAPLAKAGKSLLAVVQNTALSNGEILPGVKLPIPENPSLLNSERSTGKYFQDPELNFARFINSIEDVDSCQDALEYAHICMQLISSMAYSISKSSPVRPTIPVIIPIKGSFKINNQTQD